jgi:hypothetical protein
MRIIPMPTTIEQMLARAGITDPAIRRKMSADLLTATSGDDDADLGLPRASAVHESLKTVSALDATARGDVVKALVRAGHVHDDMNEAMHASAAILTPLQREALANAKRIGVSVKRESIDRN